MDNTQHTANYLSSRFLCSKISIEKKYAITCTNYAIIRYMCDSIDINNAKHKKYETKLYQSQIAKFTHLTRKTVNKALQHLFKIKLFKKVKSPNGKLKKNTYTLGRLLPACNRRLQEKEVSPKVTDVRSVTLGYTSNSSYITNNSKRHPFKHQKQKPAAGVETQTTAHKADTYVKKELSEEGKKHYEEAMRAAGSRSKRTCENLLVPDKT